jgi:hypothetical protein
MTSDKLLRHSGPLERLFAGSPMAAILDFFILGAQEDQIYSDSEIARLSGLSLTKAKPAISGLQNLQLLLTEAVLGQEDDGYKSAKRSRKNKYRLNRHNKIMIQLERLVLTLTDTETRSSPSIPVQKVSDDDIDQQHIGYGIGETAKELIEKGLFKSDDQTRR